LTAALGLPRRGFVAPGPYLLGHLLLVPLLLGLAALAIQHGPLDLALARLFADPVTHTFSLRGSRLLDLIGHEAARGLPIVIGVVGFAAGLCGLRYAPLKPWAPILISLGLSILLGPVLVNLLKGMTTQHCPNALDLFGGSLSYDADRAAPFWAASRETAGRCLPSGHASGGYALLSLYFAGWAAGRPEWRWSGLAIGIGAGLVFSIVRMLQGAHFASATVWSAAVDWTVCAAVFYPLLCRRPGPPR